MLHRICKEMLQILKLKRPCSKSTKEEESPVTTSLKGMLASSSMGSTSFLKICMARPGPLWGFTSTRNRPQGGGSHLSTSAKHKCGDYHLCMLNLILVVCSGSMAASALKDWIIKNNLYLVLFSIRNELNELYTLNAAQEKHPLA